MTQPSDGKTLADVLAAELRAESARKRLNQAAIARAIGRSQSTVSTKADGTVPLTVEEFVLWCRALKVEPGSLLTRVLREWRRTNTTVTPLPDTQADYDTVADESPDEDALREERGE